MNHALSFNWGASVVHWPLLMMKPSKLLDVSLQSLPTLPLFIMLASQVSQWVFMLDEPLICIDVYIIDGLSSFLVSYLVFLNRPFVTWADPVIGLPRHCEFEGIRFSIVWVWSKWVNCCIEENIANDQEFLLGSSFEQNIFYFVWLMASSPLFGSL